MERDRAREIVQEQLKKHQIIAKWANELGDHTIARDHREIADALAALLEVCT